MPSIGIVIIGRNEGERLVRSLQSALGRGAPVVYVDSGSSDDSIAAAQSLGAETIELDRSAPFTAARGRNAGLNLLLSRHPDIQLLQFVDGDCELDAGWVPAAGRFLEANSRAAAAFGRLRERAPEASVYNRLSELEWDEPAIGEVRSCGGIVMMRVEAIRAVGGFREGLIAGEEPELCVRLREAGWSIHRIDAEMATHDAAMTRFGQWWKRSVRAGHASAQGAWLHGRGRDRHGVRTIVSALAWGAVLPIAAIAAAPFTHFWSLLVLALLPAQCLRLTVRQVGKGRPLDLAWRYAGLLMIAKFAHVIGLIRFIFRGLLGRPGGLIEYKSVQSMCPPATPAAEGPR